MIKGIFGSAEIFALRATRPKGRHTTGYGVGPGSTPRTASDGGFEDDRRACRSGCRLRQVPSTVTCTDLMEYASKPWASVHSGALSIAHLVTFFVFSSTRR